MSDTHVPVVLPALPGSLLDALQGVDAIFHAGDLVTSDVLTRLGRIAPVTAVAGNMDPPEVASKLPTRTTTEMDGRRVGLHHGHQRHALQNLYIGRPYEAPEFSLFFQTMAAQLPGAQIVVFGHFHRPMVMEWRGILFVNPGSVAPPHERPTCAILSIGKAVQAEIIPL